MKRITYLIIAAMALMLFGCKTYKVENEHYESQYDSVAVEAVTDKADTTYNYKADIDSMQSVIDRITKEYYSLMQRDSVYERDSISTVVHEDGSTDTYHYKEKYVSQITKELQNSYDSISSLNRQVKILEDSIYTMSCILEEHNSFDVEKYREEQSTDKEQEKSWWDNFSSNFTKVMLALIVILVAFFIVRHFIIKK